MVGLPSFPSFEWDFLVIDTPKGEDLILGFDFVNHFNPSIHWRQGLITFDSDHKDYYDPSKCFSNDFSSSKSCAALVGDSRTPSFPSSVHITSPNSHQSLLSSRDEVFKEIQDVGKDNSVSSLHLFFGNMDLPPSSYHDSLEELWDEKEEPEEVETVMKVVPSSYHQYLDVLSKVKEEKLPPHRACDHHIKLEGSLPPVVVIYSLSNQDSDTLRAYISENVEKGFIRPSSSSTGAPVIFVKKEDGGLSSHCFNGSSILSKIYLHGAYILLRIKEGDEHLTAFRTKYRSYEYLVMPFGLTNTPSSSKTHVNDIFHDILDFCFVVYFDYIMVFSKCEEGHVTHVSTVLTRLKANDNLFAKASKCLFHVTNFEYLGYVVSYEGIKMDQAKFQQILNCPPPRNLKSLQSFLGFANFYHRFIKNYSNKISSLTIFLKRDSCFPLNEEALSQFYQLKEAFTTGPILLHFNPSLPTIVETNASNYALGAVLSQVSYSGKRPIALAAARIFQQSSILVIVDRFSKMEVFIPIMSSITSLDFAHLFIKNIFSNHGLPSSIQLNISRYWSTAYHPETDRQTEMVNKILERNPQFDSVHITQIPPAGKVSTKIESLQQDVKRELEVAINRLKRYVEKSSASPSIFNPGDMVWHSFKNIKSTRPTKKLSERWLGPFPISKKISTHAYHLKLPSIQSSIFPSLNQSRY
ncbi:hypothetical protein O181_028783 [Austropuccinia psidii MF-1]|uniref:Reverse transcriptase domain-containing protein n=1 Tax=Austropuccinia psidii MF-1 TaxID=1389203 RepID=A0A9Q3H257_9BASI|nr:hypothetical protein [Austropuccinia psidii MF-1]